MPCVLGVAKLVKTEMICDHARRWVAVRCPACCLPIYHTEDTRHVLDARAPRFLARFRQFKAVTQCLFGSDSQFRRRPSTGIAAYQDRSRTLVSPAFDGRSSFSGISTSSSGVWSIPPLRAAPVVVSSYHPREHPQRSDAVLERRGQERATRTLGFRTNFNKRTDLLEGSNPPSPRRVDVVRSLSPWPDRPPPRNSPSF